MRGSWPVSWEIPGPTFRALRGRWSIIPASQDDVTAYRFIERAGRGDGALLRVRHRIADSPGSESHAAPPMDASEVLKGGLRARGAFADAVTALQQALASGRAGDASADWLELARAFIDQRQGKRALRECDQIHKLSAFKEQLCVAEGQLLQLLRERGVAGCRESAPRSSPTTTTPPSRGVARSQLGRPGEAEAVFRAEPIESSKSGKRRYFWRKVFDISQGTRSGALRRSPTLGRPTPTIPTRVYAQTSRTRRRCAERARTRAVDSSPVRTGECGASR